VILRTPADAARGLGSRRRHDARRADDAEGGIVGLDIDGASKKLDLTTLETVALPVETTRVA
jgi:hypothetical protein